MSLFFSVPPVPAVSENRLTVQTIIEPEVRFNFLFFQEIFSSCARNYAGTKKTALRSGFWRVAAPIFISLIA